MYRGFASAASHCSGVSAMTTAVETRKEVADDDKKCALVVVCGCKPCEENVVRSNTTAACNEHRRGHKRKLNLIIVIYGAINSAATSVVSRENDDGWIHRSKEMRAGRAIRTRDGRRYCDYCILSLTSR